jgi:hypothetical protein
VFGKQSGFDTQDMFAKGFAIFEDANAQQVDLMEEDFVALVQVREPGQIYDLKSDCRTL